MSIQVVAFNLEDYSNFQDAKLSGALEVLDTPDFNSNPKGALKCASNYLAAARRFSSADIAIGLVLPNDEDTNHPLFIAIDVAGQSIISPDSLKQQELTEEVIATICSGFAEPKSVDFVYFDSSKYETIDHAIEGWALRTFHLPEQETSYDRMDNIQRAIKQVSQFNGVTATFGAYDPDSKTFISMAELDNAARHTEWQDLKQAFIIARRLKFRAKFNVQ